MQESAFTESARPPGRIQRLRRALGFAAPYRKTVGVIFLFTLALAGVNAAEPLILKYVFDSLVSKPEMKVLALGIAGMLGLGIFRELASGFSNWLTWHTRLNLHYELLQMLVERLHKMPLAFHRTEGVGAIMTKLDRSIQGFIGAVSLGGYYTSLVNRQTCGLVSNDGEPPADPGLLKASGQ